MMNHYLKNFVLLISLLVFSYMSIKAQNVTVNAKLDRESIPIGDQTKLHLSIRFAAKDTVSFPKLADSIAGKLQIINISKADTTFDKDDISIETIHRAYTLTGFDTGQYVVPQYEFKTKNGFYKTQEQVLQIMPVKVDTSKGIYDIKQPIAVSYSFMEWLRDNWPKVAFPLLAVLAIVAFIIYWRKRPKKVGAPKPAEPQKPAHVVALNRLYALRDEKLWQQGHLKEYHSEISDVMRDYLETRYQVKAHEQTTDEIFAAIRYKDIPEPNRNMLRQILVLADLVKFAKEKPIGTENENSLNSAIDFVVETQRASVITTQPLVNDADGGEQL
jgi:hypothetical protein